jgi:cytochrome c556
MNRVLLPAVLLVLGATAVAAQNLTVIKERQDLLEAIGKAVKQPGAAFRGEDTFDLAKVQAALKIIQTNAAKLPDLFPDDSKTGEDTEALPIIWQEKKDFADRYPKLVADAKAAETSITDEVSFQEVWPKLMGNCSGCHKKFRKPKS